MFALKFFKEAAEDCGFVVSEPRQENNETVIEMHRKTSEGDWWETIRFSDPEEIPDIIAEKIDTYDIDEPEPWYNEETGEYETFDSLVDNERWKVEILTDLLNELVV